MTPAAATATPLSVIISCFNGEATLAHTLEAVARQEHDGWYEVLVMDNGSTDASTAVAARFQGAVPNLRIIPVPEPGHQARALNAGIQAARGDDLVFLDSDDEIAADYLRHMSAALAASPFVGAAMDIDTLNAARVRRRRPPLQVDRIDTYCHYRPAVVGAAMGARREVLERVGGFDETLSTQHDLDISWRLLDAGVHATFVPEAVLHYRYRPTARATFRQEHGYDRGEVTLFCKFRDRGMPRPSVARVGLAYARMAWAMVTVWQPGGAVRLATRAGMNAGRAHESWRSRTTYL